MAATHSLRFASSFPSDALSISHSRMCTQLACCGNLIQFAPPKLTSQPKGGKKYGRKKRKKNNNTGTGTETERMSHRASSAGGQEKQEEEAKIVLRR